VKRLVNPVAARTDPLVLECFYQHDFISSEPEDFEQYAVLANGLVHPEPPCLYVYILGQQHKYHNVVVIATKKLGINPYFHKKVKSVYFSKRKRRKTSHSTTMWYDGLSRMFHELLSRDCGDGCDTGQPQGVGSEAHLTSTSQDPTPEDARKDGQIHGHSHAAA